MHTHSTSLIRLIAIIMLLLLGSSACTDDEVRAADGWAGTVDTLEGGRVRVSNPEQGLWREGEGWRLVEDLRIGAQEGRGPEVLSAVSGVEVDALGRLWVAEPMANEIRVFGSDGRHVRTVGRPGSGPGELQQIAGMAWAPDGQLWVVDPGNARYAVFDTTGRPVAVHPRRSQSVVMPWPGGFGADGWLYDVGLVLSAGAPGDALVRLGPQWEPDDTLAIPRHEPARFERRGPGGQLLAAADVPFTPQVRWTRSAAGGIWVGTGKSYRLDLVAFGGDTVRTVERRHRPAKVSAAERAAAVEGMAWWTAQGGRVDPSRIPGEKPAFDGLMEDDRGYLWVSAFVEEGTPAGFDVFDPEGRYLGRAGYAQAPGQGQVTTIRGAHAYGFVVDDVGIPYVVRWRIEGRAPES